MTKLPGRWSVRKTVLGIVAAIVAVAVIGFVLIYFVLFPTSSPKPFTLSTPTSAAARRSSGTTSGSGATIAGRWTVAPASQAGYRVREQLAFLPAESDAVGRTSQISGSATFHHSGSAVTITAARFTVAVNTLTSDRSMRDEKIHTIGLESDRYPTATFVLTRHAPRERAVRPRRARLGDGRPHDSRDAETGDDPARNDFDGHDRRGGRVDHLSLERVPHDRPEHRRLCHRHRPGDDGIRPAPDACVTPSGPIACWSSTTSPTSSRSWAMALRFQGFDVQTARDRVRDALAAVADFKPPSDGARRDAARHGGL